MPQLPVRPNGPRLLFQSFYWILNKGSLEFTHKCVLERYEG